MLVQAVVVVFGVVGLRRVDDEQAGSPDELFGGEEPRKSPWASLFFWYLFWRIRSRPRSRWPYFQRSIALEEPSEVLRFFLGNGNRYENEKGCQN